MRVEPIGAIGTEWNVMPVERSSAVSQIRRINEEKQKEQQHNELVNTVVPNEMNRIAKSFSDKVAFYDFSGNIGTYDYSSLDVSI